MQEAALFVGKTKQSEQQKPGSKALICLFLILRKYGLLPDSQGLSDSIIWSLPWDALAVEHGDQQR
jgi:hypothetical protein